MGNGSSEEEFGLFNLLYLYILESSEALLALISSI